MSTYNFTLYTYDDFSVCGRIVGRKEPLCSKQITKQQKTKHRRPKSHFTRVPRKSVPLEDQPRNIVETPILLQVKELAYDTKILQKFYEQQRLLEFAQCAREILNKRLHPDVCKFGFWFPLSSCPPQLIHNAFSGQNGSFWEQPHKITVDGFVEKPIRRYYYFKDILPDLGKENWFVRYHGDNNPNYNGILRSFYRELVIIVEQSDGRVYCHYSFITQQKVGELWIDC